MTLLQQAVIVGAGVVATMLTRFVPFVLFRPGRPTPRYVLYLGRVLPASVFALLVVYCLKDITFGASPGGVASTGLLGVPFDTVARLLSVAFTVAIHAWRKSMMWSIVAGTLLYMTLIRI
ncbi:MAG TPA: branched-chain amino acid transporter AzlD [Prevotella sp.]|nr:branched-chain amino acid transporter AzlD [Prevotella sp.]